MTLTAPNQVVYTAAGLVGLALLPLWLSAHGHGVAALAIFAFFSKVCHQHASRSLVLAGHPAAVCVRCLGVYAGVALGGMLRIPAAAALWGLAAALLLTAADVAGESAGLHPDLPLLRFLIGAGLGIAAGAVLSLPLDAPISRSKAQDGRRPGLR